MSPLVTVITEAHAISQHIHVAPVLCVIVAAPEIAAPVVEARVAVTPVEMAEGILQGAAATVVRAGAIGLIIPVMVVIEFMLYPCNEYFCIKHVSVQTTHIILLIGAHLFCYFIIGPYCINV